jgi:hypothetical protein
MTSSIDGRWSRPLSNPFRPEQVETARALIGACPDVLGEVTGRCTIFVVLRPTPEAVALLARLVEGLES